MLLLLEHAVCIGKAEFVYKESCVDLVKKCLWLHIRKHIRIIFYV
jgi:hypothetical protein